MADSKKQRNTAVWAILFLILFSAVFVAILAALVLPDDNGGFDSPFNGEKVALVKIQGMIIDGTGVIEELDDWADDDEVKAIIIRIISPGGMVAPSQEIHDAVVRATEKKPVVCSMGHVAASGGYYIAAPCNKIIANSGTITGSIGVIMMFDTMYELWEKIGFGSVVIKSGKYKDTGSPYRPFNKEERALMQGLVDDFFGQFIEAVAKGRKITDKEALKLSGGGRVYTGRQAKEIGLVDELGGMKEAIKIAGELAGIEGEPEIVEKVEERDFFERLLDEKFEVSLPKKFLSHPNGAYYLWAPGR